MEKPRLREPPPLTGRQEVEFIFKCRQSGPRVLKPQTIKTRFTFLATWIHPGFSNDAHFIGEWPPSARPFTSATQAASLPISLSVSVSCALSSHDSGQVISQSTPPRTHSPTQLLSATLKKKAA